MQASNAQPQTPMLSAPQSSTMDRALQTLQRNQEIQQEQRQVNNPLQRLSLEVEQINNSMKIMQEEMRRDIRARRKYFLEEQKLRREETKDLRRIRTAALLDVRAALAAGSGLLALKEFSEGDIGGGLQAAGVGIASLAPEITDLVISILAAKGLIGAGRGVVGGGARGLGAAGLLRNIGGKKGLFLIAALAASLLGGQLLGGGGNDADVRRLRETRKQVGGANLINDSDVDRFRGQLNRFERILDDIGTAPTKKRQTRTSQREIEDIENADESSSVASTNDVTNAMNLFGKEISDGVTKRNEEDGGREVVVNQDTGNIEAGFFTDESEEDARRIIEAEDKMFGISDARAVEEDTISSLTSLLGTVVPIEGVTDTDLIGRSGMVEEGVQDASTFTELSEMLADKDISSKEFMPDDDFLGPKWLGIKNPFKGDKNESKEIIDDNNTNSNTSVEALDLSSTAANTKGKPQVSNPLDGNIFVDTNFESDTGSIFDKLDSKLAYRSYAVVD